MNPLAAHFVTPNIVYRYFAYPAGEGYPGHTHSIDHPTIVVSGRVRVEIEGEEAKEYKAPAHFIAVKDKEHKITAIEGPAIWLCLFVPPAGGDDAAVFWS